MNSNQSSLSGCVQSSRVRIRPFTGTINQEYVLTIWELLQGAIRQILGKNSSGLSFEELYRNAYTMVLHKHGEMLYSGLKDTVTDHMISVVRPRILECLESPRGILDVVRQAWQDHETAMVMIRDILMYMDRVYINPDRGLEGVYQLGLSLFRDRVIQSHPVADTLCAEMISVVMRDRNGEVVDRALVRNICVMLEQVASDSERFRTYEDVFERKFLIHSAQFHSVKASRMLETRDASFYLKQTERMIAEEAERARQMMLPRTLQPLIDVITKEMLTKRIADILDMESSGIDNMLMFQNIDDLSRAYRLFARVQENHRYLAERIGLFVLRHGSSLCLVDGKYPTELAGSDRIKRSVEAIESILNLRADFDLILESAFINDAAFKSAISSAFESVLNNGTFGPECLAIYIDSYLRKGSKVTDEEQMVKLIGRVIVLFRYLMEKDAFERYYKHYLSYRLLTNRSCNEEHEKLVIARLKNECGANYTSKLEGMFRDVLVSSQLNESFRQLCPPIPISFTGLVLTTGFWPNLSQDLTLNLPAAAKEAFQEFTRFYSQKHNGRQLRLIHQFSTFELFFKPDPDGGRKFILLVNPVQMIILYAFNGRDGCSLEVLTEATGLPSEDCQAQLRVLSAGNGEGSNLLVFDGSRYLVNGRFRSKQVRLRLNHITSAAGGTRAFAPSQRQQSEMQERIMEDRRHEMDACIVRVMKARRSLLQPLLIQEVTDQLKARFTPNIAVMKQRIEHLIDREFISRDPENRKVYNYLA